MSSARQKTTVYLEADDYQRLKRIARARKLGPAQALREAVAEYVVRHARPHLPRTLAAHRSGRKDLGSRADELLGGFGRSS